MKKLKSICIENNTEEFESASVAINELNKNNNIMVLSVELKTPKGLNVKNISTHTLALTTEGIKTVEIACKEYLKLK